MAGDEMLEEILTYLHNWFCSSVNISDYTIESGTLSLPFLTEGQYFRIVGSKFNDGVYQYTEPEEETEEEEEEETEEEETTYTWISIASAVSDYSDGTFYYDSESLDGVTVVNIQYPGFATASGIYMTAPLAVESVSINGVDDSTQYDVSGAGVVIHCSALTSRLNEVELTYSAGTAYILILNASVEEEETEEESTEEAEEDTEAVFTDETFHGAVWALSIPPALLSLVSEIEEWQEKYGSTATGPYQSESFGGYSYSKATSATGNSSVTWMDVYASRLAGWRKI